MRFDVITFGSAVRDVFLQSRGFTHTKVKKLGKGTYECFPYGSKVEIDDLTFDTGGGGANSATTFAGLGYKTALVSRVGCDGAGHIIRDRLSGHGIDLRYLSEDKKLGSGYSTILLRSSGERTVLIYRGASRVFNTRYVAWKRLQARWFYVSSCGGDIVFLRKVFSHAKRVGAKIAWNPGSLEIAKGWSQLEPLLRRCDYFQLNREEAAKLTRRDIRRLEHIFDTLENVGIPHVSVTAGSQGAYLLSGAKRVYAPVYSNECINATGSGDAYGSGFVAGLLREPEDAMLAFGFALMNSSAVVCEMGAQHGLIRKWPSKKEMQGVQIKEM